MKKLFSILMILSIVFGIEFVPVRDIPLCLSQPIKLEVKSDLSYIGSKLLEIKQNLSISNCHMLETIPYEEVEEEIDEYLQNAYDSASSTAFSSFDEYKASLDLEVHREGLMAEKVVEYIVNNANVTSAATEDAAGEASSAVAE